MLVEFEYWWLLILPLFFTLGWIAARVDIKQLIAESTSLPATYFKGLNLLIADQYHKAVDAFSEALYLNKDSLELHFVLGSLFRRTGETDRAIHLHMNLLENYELTEQQSTSIKVELAQDYFKAGLYDRAEEIFKTLRHTRYEQAALRHLLEIYVKEREWSEAIAIAIELERSSGISYRKEVAQYYCELAANAFLGNIPHADTTFARQPVGHGAAVFILNKPHVREIEHVGADLCQRPPALLETAIASGASKFALLAPVSKYRRQFGIIGSLNLSDPFIHD